MKESLLRRPGDRPPPSEAVPPTLFEGYREAVAAELSERLGVELVRGVFLRVKTTPTHHVDVYQTVYNWRLAVFPVGWGIPGGYDRAWCYTGRYGFARAYQQAVLWPPDDGVDHVPDLWYKEAFGAATVRHENLFP